MNLFESGGRCRIVLTVVIVCRKSKNVEPELWDVLIGNKINIGGKKVFM